MKKLYLLLPFFSAAFLSAQSVSGKITSEDKRKISYAEVVATLDKEKTTAISDENGNYNLNLKTDGTYNIDIFVEGEKLLTKTVAVKGDISENFIIPKISTKEGEQKLENVNITGKKKIFERKVDRLVYNVENSVASQGVDGVEALSKTPMLRVKDDAISIAGKSNVAVLVNDRPLNLSGQDLTNYLKNLRSDDIQKIEVITTPPAKYAAEGSSGLINIVLKKNSNLGWSGTLRTGATVGKTISHSDGATLNYQGKKLSLTAGGNFGEYNNTGSEINNTTGTDYYWNTSNQSKNRFTHKGGNIKTEYKLSDKSTAGVAFNYFNGRSYNNEDNTTETFFNNTINNFTSVVDNNGTFRNTNANAFYELKLDSLGSKINFSGNLMSNKMDSDNYTNTFGVTDLFSKTKNNSQYKILNGQIDLEKNFKKIRTEAGVKYAKISNNADLNFFDILNEIPVFNTSRSNRFEYDEQNYAAYLSAAFKLSEKWDTKLGLRYEYTTTEGYSPEYNQRDKNEYGKLFPTVYLNYKPNDNNSLSLNYSRRIQRPNFWSLNPFRYYSSSYEYYGGNPYMQPVFTDNLELSYTLKNNFTTTVYASKTNDEVGQLQRFENGIRYSTPENFYDETRAGINMNYNFSKLKWLESNLSASGYYAKSESNDSSVLTQEGLGANFSMDNNFFLNKAKTVTYNFGFYIGTPSKSGNTSNQGYQYFYTGLKLNLMEKNLMINLTFNDIFNNNTWKGTEYYSDYSRKYAYHSDNQNLNLSITYRFGNKNVQGATKYIKNDEESRSGGGGKGK